MTIQTKWEDIRKKSPKQSALIVYTMAGFPTLERSLEIIQTLAHSGADMIEVGFPFSDPVADGPVIQLASGKALEQKVSLSSVFQAIRELKLSVPLLLMSYLNPLLAFGMERLGKQAKQAGISGFIIPDLPVEEAEPWQKMLISHDMDLVLLAAPTSSMTRLKTIAQVSTGFIYAVSLTGTTGARDQLPPSAISFVRKLKRVTSKPVAVGFGISTPEQVNTLAQVADGVIIGSRIIHAILKEEALDLLVRSLKEATVHNGIFPKKERGDLWKFLLSL